MKKTILLITTVLGGLFANAQNPYPIVPIDTVQFVNPTKLSLVTTPAQAATATLPDYTTPVFKDTIYRDTVRIEGIVICSPKSYGLSTSRKAAFIQRKGGGPWSGVQVMCEPAGTGTTLAVLQTETKFKDNFIPGYKVRLTGVIREFSQGETQVNLIRSNPNWENGVEQLSLTPDTLVYSEITADQLMKGNPNSLRVQQKITGEQWEGTLVRLRNVTVYSKTVSNNRTTWSVIDDFGNVIDVRDFSAYFRNDANGDSATLDVIGNPSRFNAPAIGTRLEYIQGVVTEYTVTNPADVRYGIIPVYPSDYKICTACPPSIKNISRNPTVVKSSDTTKLVFEITVGDTTLQSSKLYFRNSVTNILDSVGLTSVPSFPNYYLAQIPPTNTECEMSYWVSATDKKNRNTLVPDPFSVGNRYYITGPNGVDNIRTLQYSSLPNGTTIWNGDSLLSVNVRGIVTGTGFGGLITVQDGTGPNSAIFVARNTGADSTGKWAVGDSVLITRATVRESFNVTTLNNILSSVISSGNPLPPFEKSLSIDSFANVNVSYSRKWEAVLLRFDSIEITSTNPDANNNPPGNFGEFSINKTQTLGLRVDDYNTNFKNYSNLIYVGMKMNFIQGPMYFANGNFKLIPRDANDADFSRIDTVRPVITMIGAANISVKKDSIYNDQGATATDDKEGNITSKIITTGAVVNTAIAGIYHVSYVVSDLAGNKDSVVRTVTVFYGDTTKPVIALLGKNPDTLQRNATYVDPFATATDNVDGNINAKIIRTGMVDSSQIGSYVLTYTVTDIAGNTASKTRVVVVINKVGVKEVNTIASSVKVYPSPAYAELNVSIDNINQLPAQLVITDMLGREMMKQTIGTKNFNEQLNISQLNNGVYFLNISNANGMQSIKFMVSGK
ncbi:MAG: immunoglobulin-like domain-containing protein [Bacteroidota bacterium]